MVRILLILIFLTGCVPLEKSGITLGKQAIVPRAYFEMQIWDAVNKAVEDSENK